MEERSANASSRPGPACRCGHVLERGSETLRQVSVRCPPAGHHQERRAKRAQRQAGAGVGTYETAEGVCWRGRW